MTSDHRPDANSTPPVNEPLPSVGRRRLFQGVAGSTGVLLSVHARTALGTGTCISPSGKLSGNQSPRPGAGTCVIGKDPNTWMSTCTSWPTAWRPAFQYGVAGRLQYLNTSTYPSIAGSHMASEGVKLSQILTGAPDIGVWRAMATKTSIVPRIDRVTLAYLCAAWLNSQTYNTPNARFPISEAEVKRMAQACYTGTLYCPASISCGSRGWTPAEIKTYLMSVMGNSTPNAAFVRA